MLFQKKVQARAHIRRSSRTTSPTVPLSVLETFVVRNLMCWDHSPPSNDEIIDTMFVDVSIYTFRVDLYIVYKH